MEIFLRSNQAEVDAVGSSTTTKSIVAIGVSLFLAVIGARGTSPLAVADSMSVYLFFALLDINNGHVQLGQLAVLDTLDQDVGTVVVVLVGRVGGPGHCKQTLCRVCARGHVLGDLDRPLVVDVGTGSGVLTDHLPGFAPVVRE